MRPYNFDGYWVDLDHILFIGPIKKEGLGRRVDIQFMFRDRILSFGCPNREATEEEANAERDKLIAAWRRDGKD